MTANAAIYRGLEETFWENDYHLVFSSLRDRLHEAGAPPKLVRDGHVAGLVVLRAGVQHIPWLAETGLPAVSAGSCLDDAGVDSVYPDNARAGRLAAEHLLSLGHRACLLLTGAPSDTNLRDRAESFVRTLQASAGRIVAAIEVDDQPLEWAAAMQLREYLAQHGRPFTAIAAMTDRRANGALLALQEAGIAVPGEVSVIGFLGLTAAGGQHPPLTSVYCPAQDIGRIAAHRLLDRLQRPDELSELKIMVPVKLVTRQSTAAPGTEMGEGQGTGVRGRGAIERIDRSVIDL